MEENIGPANRKISETNNSPGEGRGRKLRRKKKKQGDTTLRAAKNKEKVGKQSRREKQAQDGSWSAMNVSSKRVMHQRENAGERSCTKKSGG